MLSGNSSVLIITVLLWLIALTVIIVVYKKLKQQIDQSQVGVLSSKLNSTISQQSSSQANLDKLTKKVQDLVEEKNYYIQKVGLIKFNPFTETGGENSFCLAALDSQDSGFVITGLHSRESTRFYVKLITKGNSSQKLSKEERQAITKAEKLS